MLLSAVRLWTSSAVVLTEEEAKQANRTPAEGGYGHSFTLVRGPNNTDMYMTTVDRLAVSVTESSFPVEIDKPATPIASTRFHEP